MCCSRSAAAEGHIKKGAVSPEEESEKEWIVKDNYVYAFMI